ncbi:TPA: LOW QUALITY PROTEIN: hypothetical protein N0F65_008448, partial [Lagenidium giganteum]
SGSFTLFRRGNEGDSANNTDDGSDHHTHQLRRMAPSRKALIIGIAVTLCVIAGIVVGVVLSQSSSTKATAKGGNSNTESASGGNKNSGKSSGSDSRGTVRGAGGSKAGGSKSASSTGSKAASSSGSSSGNSTNKVSSDPTKEKFTVATFAIGDWGTTTTRGSCCQRRAKFTNTDVFAEDIVAALMDKQAGKQDLKPQVVMSHGDNFYWTGINGDSDQASRFQTTFEDKFSGSNLKEIPWVNVLGNHDYGGASYVCSSGGENVPCKSADELVAALDEKFKLQQSYKSPQGDRWVLKDHFFVHSIKDSSGDVTMDIFNIDTNDADTHALEQICCQCYGYSKGSKQCSQVHRGHEHCAGGDNAMFDACAKKIKEWGEDSRTQLLEKLKTSKATWKVVNTHYSPYNHYAPEKMKVWFEALKGAGVNIWINGHTHGEKHDYSESLKIHFIENGAGGGIASEAASGIPPYATEYVKQFWTYGGEAYGFFTLDASKEWVKLQYISYPRSWQSGSNFKASDLPEVETQHCWYIPVDGSKGQVCDAKAEYPPLHEAATSSGLRGGMAFTRRKALIIGGVVTLCAIIGAVVGIVLWQTSSKKVTSKDGNTNAEGAGGGSKSGGSTTKSPKKSSGSRGGGSSSDGNSTSKVSSDPTKEKFSLAAFAIGDWGTTITPDSCCKRRSKYTNTDLFAEDIVAALMDKQAGKQDLKPQVVIGHGDNFYWTGINGDSDQASRFQTTFEEKFSGSNLKEIPWVNVLGNHDYGGASYVCSSGGKNVPCKSADELVSALEDKFKWQQSYKSPQGNRWLLKDRFFVHSIKDSSGDVTMDIFNIDTNDADTHGLEQICCQCYGYSNGGSDCDQVHRGHKNCAGGDSDMFDACSKKLKEWAKDSRTQLLEKLKSSTATWKVVNTHYSPYNHYSPPNMKDWFDALKDAGVNIWINGHTHGEKHDYSGPLKIHFIENGAGGGIASESASGIPPYASDYIKQFWTYAGESYGFFTLDASKEWVKLQYISFPRSWQTGTTFKASDLPDVETQHCWYIPVDGSKGQVCDAKAEYPPLHADATSSGTIQSNNDRLSCALAFEDGSGSREHRPRKRKRFSGRDHDSLANAPSDGQSASFEIVGEMVQRKGLFIGLIACAVIAAVVGNVVWQTSSKKAASKSGNSNNNSNAASSGSKSGGTSGKSSKKSGSGGGGGTSGNSSGNSTSKVTSDPTKEKFSLAAFAIGDWGTTTTPDSCCKRRSKYTNTDLYAEDIVATLMDKQAGKQDLKPQVVIGHGDNFYWTGINGDSDQATRFQTTFEEKFSGSNLKEIPWVNVLGNHDYGGASYVCSSGGNNVPCKSADELVSALEDKFKWQQSYKSPQGNRWLLKDRFFVYTIKDSKSSVSMDIFNIDTNDADTHGLEQICCQCYGYSNGSKTCDEVHRGNKNCAGGDNDMFDACSKKLKEWAKDSRTQLLDKLKSSNATWKVVNSHYSPYNHYSPPNMKGWFADLKGAGVNIWINGHTHGEKHDYSDPLKIHFIENGAGGGIASESASGVPPYASDYISQFWTYGGEAYGFFTLDASKDWLKLQYVSFPRSWQSGSSFKASDLTDVEVQHCWYIPVDGSKGQVCDAKAEYPPLHAGATSS